MPKSSYGCAPISHKNYDRATELYIFQLTKAQRFQIWHKKNCSSAFKNLVTWPMTKFKISKNIHFLKNFLGVLKEMFSNNISIEKIKKMGVFRLMARLGLSELAFVWSFYTVAQSIAFILLLSNKNVITGYIMTITRRKNSQTIFWEQRHIQGVGGGQAGGADMLPRSKWSHTQNAEVSSQRHW